MQQQSKLFAQVQPILIIQGRHALFFFYKYCRKYSYTCNFVSTTSQYQTNLKHLILKPFFGEDANIIRDGGSTNT